MAVVIISGIAVDVRKKKVKNMNLRVTPDCRVTLSVPMRTSDRQIEEFISSRKEWIEKALAKFLNSDEVRRWFGDGGEIRILGERFKVEDRIGEKPMCQISNGTAYLTFPEDYSYSQKERYMMEWYRIVLKEVLPDMFARMEALTGLHCSGYRTKIMKTRWGTCNYGTKLIWLNVRLAEKPLKCIEYVVLHELVHTAIPDHGERFKAMMDTYMHDWRERRKLLNYGVRSE